MWFCLLAVDAYAVSLNLVGALLFCGVIGVVLYFVWNAWLDRQGPLFFSFESEEESAYECVEIEQLEPDTRLLDHLTLEQLLDEALMTRAKSQTIEAAICKAFAINRNSLLTREERDLYDRIVAAVYDGREHSELMSLHHKRVHGTRWHPSTSRARAVC